MRNILFLALFSVLPAQAITFQDLRGQWKANHSETTNGQGLLLKATVTGSKRADGGIVLKEKVTSPVAITATYTFTKDGKFKSVAVRNGNIIFSTYTGTWKISKGVININAKGSGEKFYATITGNKNSFHVKGTYGNSKLTIKGKRN